MNNEIMYMDRSPIKNFKGRTHPPLPDLHPLPKVKSEGLTKMLGGGKATRRSSKGKQRTVRLGYNTYNPNYEDHTNQITCLCSKCLGRSLKA